MTDQYYDALSKCGERYRDMLSVYIDQNEYWGWTAHPTSTDAKELKSFIAEFIAGCANQMPLMKLNRWLGYIQGSLIQWKITSVQVERDWTRPLFRPMDYDDET